ncbi:MAG: hypothetical protein J7L38_06840 [Thermoproteales archaeon]|nr:hypothetical protein [Thermoproteales archaeon]
MMKGSYLYHMVFAPKALKCGSSDTIIALYVFAIATIIISARGIPGFLSDRFPALKADSSERTLDS